MSQGAVWKQREDIRKELRLIRESLERLDSLGLSILKVQRLIATNTSKLTEKGEVGVEPDWDAAFAERDHQIGPKLDDVAVLKIVRAAIGDRLLINPPTEEE